MTLSYTPAPADPREIPSPWVSYVSARFPASTYAQATAHPIPNYRQAYFTPQQPNRNLHQTPFTQLAEIMTTPAKSGRRDFLTPLKPRDIPASTPSAEEWAQRALAAEEALLRFEKQALDRALADKIYPN